MRDTLPVKDLCCTISSYLHETVIVYTGCHLNFKHNPEHFNWYRPSDGFWVKKPFNSTSRNTMITIAEPFENEWKEMKTLDDLVDATRDLAIRCKSFFYALPWDHPVFSLTKTLSLPKSIEFLRMVVYDTNEYSPVSRSDIEHNESMNRITYNNQKLTIGNYWESPIPHDPLECRCK
jgi:hypothetical protein